MTIVGIWLLLTQRTSRCDHPAACAREVRAVKKIAIVQSNYIPWKGYFDLVNSVDEFVILDEVQFTKNDWRNRNRIKTPAGVHWLSIPVRHERLAQTISATRVMDARWAERHWKTLRQNYSRTPYFDCYAPTLEEAYREASGLELLSDINLLLLQVVCGLLGIRTRMVPCTRYVFSNERNARLLDICQQAGADLYLSGPAARSYLNVNAFSAAGVEVRWMEYGVYAEYPQPHPPFVHAVTVLDLLFSTGPAHRAYMNSFEGICNGSVSRESEDCRLETGHHEKQR